MNGRVYDPMLGRFISADPFIQAPKDSQSYNRYSYVLNNPLTYTDPSGYFSFKKLFKFAAVAIVAIYVPQLISNAFLTSAANAAAASASLSASTAFATAGIGLEAGSLTALGSFAANAAGGFASALVASNGDFGFAIQSGIAVGLTAGLGQYGGELAGAPGSVAGKTIAGGVSAQAFGGSLAEGIKNGFLGAVRSEAYAYMQRETDKFAVPYWNSQGGPHYDDRGSPWTYGNRGCAVNASDACDSLFARLRLLMPIEFHRADSTQDSFYRPLWKSGLGLGEIPFVGGFLNAVSKVHDFGNHLLTAGQLYVTRQDGNEPYGSARNFGFVGNTIVDAISTSTMIPSARLTARALYSNPLTTKGR